jgi:hypothetical protein
MARLAARSLTLAPILVAGGLLSACGDKQTPGPGSGDTADTGDTGDDGGGSEAVVWEDLRLESNKTFTSCYASGAGLYATTETGEVWLRSQGDWNEIDLDTDGNALNGIWGTGQGEAATLVVVGDGGVAAIWQAGVWTPTDVGTNNLQALSGPSLGDLLAVGWGTYFQWNGTEWSGGAIDGNPRFNAVTYGGNVAWAVGEDGVLGRLRQGAWETWNHESRAKLYGVGASGNGVVLAVGEAGTVLSWDGAAFGAVESPTDVSLWAVNVDASGLATVTGNNGEAWRYFDGSWTRLPTGVDNNLYAVCASTTGIVWAVGNRGMALRLNQ